MVGDGAWAYDAARAPPQSRPRPRPPSTKAPTWARPLQRRFGANHCYPRPSSSSPWATWRCWAITRGSPEIGPFTSPGRSRGSCGTGTTWICISRRGATGFTWWPTGSYPGSPARTPPKLPCSTPPHQNPGLGAGSGRRSTTRRVPGPRPGPRVLAARQSRRGAGKRGSRPCPRYGRPRSPGPARRQARGARLPRGAGYSSAWRSNSSVSGHESVVW